MENTMPARSNYGWLRDPFDGNDHPYTTKLTTFPKKVNLLEKFPAFCHPVYNQGELQSCVANAAAAIYSFELKRHIHEAQIKQQAIEPSRMFIYYNARSAMWDPESKEVDVMRDGGCFPRFAMKALEKLGVCEEISWPYVESKFGEMPPESAYREATAYTIVKYEKLDVNRPHHDKGGQEWSEAVKKKDGEDLLRNLQLCLAEGHPAFFGFWAGFPPWSSTKGPQDLPKMDTMKKLPMIEDPRIKKALLSMGHALIAVGYDAEEQLVLCQNSYGNDKNPENPFKVPFFWMPYEWIADFMATDDFWMMRLVK